MTKTPSPAKKIALLGPFGFGNLGDAAIQQAMIQNVHQRLPGAKVIGVSMHVEDTEKRHHIPAFPIGRVAFGWGLNKPADRSGFYRLMFSLRNHTPPVIQKLVKLLFWLPTEIAGYLEAFLFLANLDLLIVSGGGQLDDSWGGAWHHPFSLMMWGVLASLRRVDFKFVSVGAAPLDSYFGRLFSRIALSFASYRSFRDGKSKNFMANVAGFRRDDPVYPDLAFSLSTEKWQPLSERKADAEDEVWVYPHTSSPIVAVGPMAYYDPRIWPKKDPNVYLAYLNKLADFVLWLMSKGYDILLFPGEATHDLAVINDLKAILARHAGAYNPDQILHPRIETVEELMAQLATANMVVASRFHGVLLSELLYKPLVALSYHPKVDELMTDTGQGHYCLQIHDFDLGTLKTRFTELEANRETASEQIARRVNEYRAALDEQYERIFGNS